jgi:serine protease AprX
VKGDDSERYFRGSGTSQATAFVAGVVALLLDVEHGLKPDEVKALLTSTARPVDGSAAGVVDVLSALSLAKDVKTLSDGTVLEERSKRVLAGPGTDAWSTGGGSLEAARGGEHVIDPTTGIVLSGEVDAQGAPWSGGAWASMSGNKKAWDKGAWNGQDWTGDKFEKRNWKFVPWAARSWREDSWSARSWRSLL